MSRRRSSHDDALLGLFEESGRNVERTGTLLRELMTEFPERSALARDILICEQEGDRITHDIIHRLGNGTKLDRGDAYELARALDDVVDFAEETADSLELYAVEAPMVQAEELAEVLAGAAAAVRSALSLLRHGDDISSQLVEIHRLENEGDRISREAIASLFKSGTDPMVVIRWKDIFESLEQAIDSCETVAHVLEGIELKRRG
jgi:predicted phosphate transport protein (TIGR00153 family)